MPIRVYKCRVCGTEWEELRKDQTDPERCTICKCDTVERKLTAGSFTFGGGGYKHGYTSSGRNNG